MTEQERSRLAQARQALGPCIDERYELLADFFERLGLPDAQQVRHDAARFLPDVAAWVDGQAIDPSDRAFLLLRLAVLAGEVLAQRLSGSWFLDDRPGSPDFGQYVVGRFAGAVDAEEVVNPFRLANASIAELEAGGPVSTPMGGATAYVTGSGEVRRGLEFHIADATARLRRVST